MLIERLNNLNTPFNTVTTGYSACNCNYYPNKCDSLVKSIVEANFPILWRWSQFRVVVVVVAWWWRWIAVWTLIEIYYKLGLLYFLLLLLFSTVACFVYWVCCPRAKSCWKVFNKIVASACCMGPKGKVEEWKGECIMLDTGRERRRQCNNCVNCSPSLSFSFT